MSAINRNKFGYALSSIVFVILIARATAVQQYEHTEVQPPPCIEWVLNDGRNDTTQDCVLDSASMSFKCLGTFNASALSKVHRLRNVIGLDLCGWQSPTLDPSTIMKYFPKVQYLGISYGNLSDIVDSFPDSFHLQIINISFTNLFTLDVNLFKSVRNLKVLDLRFNKLKYLDAPLHLPSAIQELYLSANAWNCSRSLRWLLHSEKFDLVVDRNTMVCSDPQYNGRNLITVAHYKKVSKLECQTHEELRNCTCMVHYILKSEDGKSLTPIYAVNCSNLEFYHFPSYLPENTTIFYANNNKISDIRPLRNNEIYRNIVDLYLDDNNIQSIDVLEAGYWLRHFRVLSLKRNRLQKLPVYALDNALEINSNAVNLQLSQNPWVCDCKFGMRFREILMKYHIIIQDSWNVTCSFMDEEENSVLSRVLSIQRTDVCKLPQDNSLFPVDLLNGILASLIIFILAKLGYDYYNYKNYGQLPWIVTKLP